MKLTVSLLSPQTITGLLQEFDVQASRGCVLPFPFPTRCSLFPSSFRWLEGDHCADIGGVGREGASFLYTQILLPR